MTSARLPMHRDFRFWMVGLILVVGLLYLRGTAGPSHASPTDTESMTAVAEPVTLLGSGMALVQQNDGIVNIGGTARAHVANNTGTVNVGVSPQQHRQMVTVIVEPERSRPVLAVR